VSDVLLQVRNFRVARDPLRIGIRRAEPVKDEVLPQPKLKIKRRRGKQMEKMMIRFGRTFGSPISPKPLLLFFLLFPFANATAQLNSNEPCSKYVSEDLRSPFSKPPSKDQLLRADRLYSRSIVITAHDHCYSARDFADMKAGGITIRTIKLTTDNNYWDDGDAHHWPADATDKNWRDLEEDFSQPARDAIKRVKDNPDVLLIRSRADVLKAKRTGKLGVIVSFEGGAVARRPDGCDHPQSDGGKCMTNVRALYEMGLRDFQPYWVTDNWLKLPRTDGDWEHAPLNDYGVRVLEELTKLGVVIDLSHMGSSTFRQALSKLNKNEPIILSHAAVAWVSLCGNAAKCPEYDEWTKTGPSSTDTPLLASFRKEVGPPGGTTVLDDETIHEVVRRHGVIALHFMDFIVSWKRHSEGSDVTVATLVDEIDYIKTRFGIDYVSLGPDYFPWKGQKRSWVRGARDMTELKNVAIEMVIRGYSDSDIQKVLGLNLLGLYSSVWKSSQP
jgi:membrane dipeptidase